MADQDYFADIAMTQHPLGSTDKEVVPADWKPASFAASDRSFPYDRCKVAQERSDGERLSEYQEGLAALRRQYAPFMENHMPGVKTPETLELKTFQFRYLKEHEVFSQRDEAADWEDVTIPDYRGPVGKWKAYYRTRFTTRELGEQEHCVVQFQCVDYKAVIYVDGCYVGAHEGLFAPFSFDISDFLRNAPGEHELIIQVENDYSILGEGNIDGDKIYAATGPGWDDPQVGWHHCPAGAGVFGRVTVEYRPAIYIMDIFARPDIDRDHVELRVGVMNYTPDFPEDFALEVLIAPRNFREEYQVTYAHAMKVIGAGKNEFRYRIPMKAYRLWTPETPYLYGINCTITQNGETVTQGTEHFGMRKFVSDETTQPKGRFFFNNKPMILRGANEMGHLQQCVMTGDMDQLVDDILIAKLCNMNYYRLTQRPVQREIYDYMDMLGMLNQTDLPLFSFLRRPQVCEAVRQAAEMEHLLRSHPSAVLVTFINEPVCIRRTDDPNSKYSKRYEIKAQRNILRDEMEAFFVAARKMIYVENPDRVIKNVEGDYDPPTSEGMPDFHCYTMWYSNHGVPIGKLYRGYLPPVKEGWMIGCGEYGAEGLDNENIMRERYPKEWLACNEKGEWYPTKIIRAQTNSVQGDWYPEQRTLTDWVRESQKHQARATTMMTDAFRRRADVLNHTALHLLIDAWPAGWMKTIVGCDRMPKKAFYAYADSLVPLRVNLRSDRNYLYGGETYQVEAWGLNDTAHDQRVTVTATVTVNGKAAGSYSGTFTVEAANVLCAGTIPVQVPRITAPAEIHVDAVMEKEDGTIASCERLELYAYPAHGDMTAGASPVAALGEKAEQYAALLGYRTVPLSEAEKVLVTEPEQYGSQVGEALSAGKRVLLLPPDMGLGTYDLGLIKIEQKKGPSIFFADTAEKASAYHFDMLYNASEDYIDFLSRRVIASDIPGEELVFTYGKSGADGEPAPKVHRPIAEKFAVGEGTLYAATLLLEGRIGYNSNLDQFLIDCLEGRL